MYQSVEIHFTTSAEAGPSIVLYGVRSEDDQLALLQTIQVGPFPDWEAIAKRIMKAVILACQPKFG